MSDYSIGDTVKYRGIECEIVGRRGPRYGLKRTFSDGTSYTTWATAEEFFAADMCDCVTLDPVTDAEMVDDALDYAADALARMSGMRYLGTTERTLARPNIGCLTCGPYCITLRGPVIEVTAAWENGVLLTEDDYRLIGDQVHRIDAD